VTGSEMIVWGGGASSTVSFDDGARFDLAGGGELLPVSPLTTRRDQSGVWADGELLLWGGARILEGGTVYASGARFALFRP
jgi:hypothetical protein